MSLLKGYQLFYNYFCDNYLKVINYFIIIYQSGFMVNEWAMSLSNDPNLLYESTLAIWFE